MADIEVIPSPGYGKLCTHCANVLPSESRANFPCGRVIVRSHHGNIEISGPCINPNIRCDSRELTPTGQTR